MQTIQVRAALALDLDDQALLREMIDLAAEEFGRRAYILRQAGATDQADAMTERLGRAQAFRDAMRVGAAL